MNAPASLPTIAPPSRPISAPSILLYGEPGSGKTHSILTLIDAGVDVFVLITEPSGLDTLLDGIREKPERLKRLHYRSTAPAISSWSQYQEMVRVVGSMTHAAIADLKSGVGKQHIGAYEKLILSFRNFVCERTGEDFGDITTWDDSRALVVDSLSGVNRLAREQTVGSKPSMHQGEWGIAMNLEEALFFKLCMETTCFFITTAHADRVTNEVTGSSEKTVAALGNKLAPQLIKHYSEVIFTKRDKSSFLWSTAEPGAVTKSRALPISDKLQPDFAPIVKAHRERVKALGAGQP